MKFADATIARNRPAKPDENAYQELVDAIVQVKLYSPSRQTLAQWASQLNSLESATARQFTDQLASEWLPISPPDSFCQAMLYYVQSHLSQTPGWQDLWAHITRVTGFCALFGREAGLDPAECFLLGIFHDIAKFDEAITGTAHELAGANMLRTALHQDYPPAVIERLAKAIAKQGSPNDPHVKVLYDADKLDKIGAAGLMRRLATDWGALHPRAALRQVHNDLRAFPQMHSKAAIGLAEAKKMYSLLFLSRSL
jgi:HD superfamily phosphodiesterase